MIDEKKLNQHIKIAKKSISKMFYKQESKEEIGERIGGIEKFNQVIVLGVANFKCQMKGCGSENNLQIHHLIMRATKKYMDYTRYYSQRYYWANQIVLCKPHHKEYHKEFGVDIGDHGDAISQEKINEVKKLLS